MTDPKPFLDSNIWLYSFVSEQDETKHKIAESIIFQNQITISSQIINEVCSNLLRKFSFTETQIKKLTKSFYQDCSIIDLNESVFLKASELREYHSFSYWDSLVVASALL